jgi:hypothetical protein
MANLVKSIAGACKQSLASSKVKLAGLGIVAAGLMVQSVAAAEEDYSFINDTLQGLGHALLNVLPLAGDIMTAGGPVVVKGCVYFAICAVFLGGAYWIDKHMT